MKIAFIGARGYPVSYASAEDMVRELGPRFVRAGHEFTVHGWATDESRSAGTHADVYQGINRVFHATPGGKVSGQLLVALRGSIEAARSDCDLVHYQCLNSTPFCWIPRLAGKHVVINVDGQIWKDPKWPWGIRNLYFGFAALVSLTFGSKVITDSYHMSEHYRRTFLGVRLPYIGYGCSPKRPDPAETNVPEPGMESGYYMIMSRVTPHNLTDVMVDGFIESGTKSHLLVAGHLPPTDFVKSLQRRAEGKRVKFLGLVKDQDELNRLLRGCRGYLHGHSLGGINSALVRIAGLGKPIVCVDTPFNREVVEDPNKKLQAELFDKNSSSVAAAIKRFEANEVEYADRARQLGDKVRELMSWDRIYDQYRELYANCCATKAGRSVQTAG